ncbi:MAG: hypothetical protein GVY16_04150 [Planctomycetes bacterium]|jgi:hypothetical protein|nr:hypothetical protein [Planctomycetota bacterium]
MKRAVMVIISLVLVFVLAWALIPGMSCQNHQETGLPPEKPGRSLPAQVSATPSASLTFLTSVKVYIKLVIDRKYGLLAQRAGKEDSKVQRMVDSPENKWWDNPMVVYEESPLSRDPDLTAGFDGKEIAGLGKSANATVAITMIPHAEIAIATLPKCDGLKATITVRITAASGFYDGSWTKVVRVENKAVVFSFDTCDPSRRLEAVSSKTRTLPDFAFERYTRHEVKWEPRNAWPTQPENGDFWTTIYGSDGVIDVTAYKYLE